MYSDAQTVEDYLESLPDDRKHALSEIRKVILKNLPRGIKEGMQYGMIGYFIPLSRYPNGYLNDKRTPLPFASLGSQKHHMALYMNHIYTDKKLYDWFVKSYEKTGKNLDMGKSCVRFSALEDLPLPLIGRTIKKASIAEFIKQYEESRKH